MRDIWLHEAHDFTQWLALPENLALLSETLGIAIQDAQTEVGVGSFNVDIAAQDENEKMIIIENQLENTDHDHLGKIITYASGIDSSIMIWIVKKAREEHQQAIQWLNEISTSERHFILIEIQAWKIGKSHPAPRFNIIVQPNNWAKVVKEGGYEKSDISDYKLKQQAFWSKFRDYSVEHNKVVRNFQQARPQMWFPISIGTSKAHLSLSILKNQTIRCELWIPKSESLYRKLEKEKNKIESEINRKIIWDDLPDKKGFRIYVSKQLNFLDEKSHAKTLKWLNETVELFHTTFSKRVK